MEILAVEFVVKFNHEVLFSSFQAQMLKNPTLNSCIIFP